jgi:hypothetical protein
VSFGAVRLPSRVQHRESAREHRGGEVLSVYSTRSDQGACAWQEGGDFIPGTINDFGGSSATEYGTVPLATFYPGPNNTPFTRWNNFNSGDQANPCPTTG